MANEVLGAAWRHDLTSIPHGGIEVRRGATGEERARLAAALGLVACDRLEAHYTLKRAGSEHYALKGKLEAEVTQTCVVTLEPLAQHLEEAFDIELWPEDRMPRAAGGEREILSGKDLEALDNGTVDAGRIVFELVSASIDPYPRKPGAALDWSDPGDEAAGESTGPFAALGRLKDRT